MKKSTNKQIRTTFILGAGLGTRLKPLTDNTPKPLLEIGGHPIITYAMEHLRSIGVQRFIINTHHCAEKYAEAFPDSNWQDIPITFRHEPVLLDTAGSIKNIEDLMAEDERIIVYNGDIITNLPLMPLISKHFELQTEVTLALRSRGPLLNVNIDRGGYICDLRHTLKNPGVQSCLFAGIYIVEKAFLKRLNPGKIESIVLPLVEMIKENTHSVGGIVIDDGYWHDMGTAEEYKKLRNNFKEFSKTQAFSSEEKRFLSDALKTAQFELTPIKKGGSDRAFFRVSLPDESSFVFMRYGTEVEENFFWPDINDFLANINISVPHIIAQDTKRRFILMEDLGDIALCSLASLPWEKRRDYYYQALTQIRRLHSFALAKLPARLKTSKGYDRQLYLWEHNYFMDNFVEAVCQIKLPSVLQNKLSKELDALADRMLTAEPCLIHRDFQSQNIMIKNNQPVFIDFQGMRRGNLFYDLGSLICDPYVKFTAEERNESINFYYDLMKPDYSRNDFAVHFREASTQRLMQALGAYGFLGLKKNRPDFLKHVYNGIGNLILATSNTGNLPFLHELSQQCKSILADRQI